MAPRPRIPNARAARRDVRRRALVVGLALSASLVASGCAAATTPSPPLATGRLSTGDHTVSLVSGGLTRTMIVHVPPGPATATRPLLLVYPGALDSAASTESGTDFVSVANRDDEVVAFLQGYKDSWNDDLGTTPAGRAHVNDVAFTTAAIAKLRTVVRFDAKRVAAVGFSNGALMVDLLACKLASSLALVAPVEGPLPVQTSSACKPSRAVSVYEIHATGDGYIKYAGGPFTGVWGGTITVLSAPSSAARFAKLDACAASPATTTPSSSSKLTTYSKCRRGVAVSLYTIYGGAHQWAPDTAALVSAALPG